jgi:hypothetical protein
LKSIIITDDLRVLASILGGFRTLVARNSGVKDAKIGNQSGMQSDQDGILAELAFAQWWNVWPDIGLSPRSGSYDMLVKDQRIDIKATRRADGRLLATLKVNPDVDIYVLAIVLDKEIKFPGFALKGDLIQESRIRDLGHGRGYAMDQIDLRKFNEGDV